MPSAKAKQYPTIPVSTVASTTTLPSATVKRFDLTILPSAVDKDGESPVVRVSLWRHRFAKAGILATLASIMRESGIGYV